MTARLPAVLRRVAEELGDDVALAMAEAYSGRCLYVPAVMTEDHPIAKQLGFEAAHGLSQMFGVEMVDIPRCAELERERRNQRLLEAHEAGASVSTLVQRFRLSRRQVFNVLAAARDAGEPEKESAA